MSSIKSLFEKMNSRKMKVFLLFLLCSFLAWSISKLSEIYESRAEFDITYENIPDSLLFKGNGKRNIVAKIEASGFQFLSYALNPKTVTLDLENVLEQDGDYFLTSSTVKAQLENQLPNRISLIELAAPVHYTDLYLVDSKTVPIIPNINLGMAQNHVLHGEVTVEPDSVQIKGPKKVIELINEVHTIAAELNDVATDFSRKLRLRPLDSLGNIVMSQQETTVSGKVVRFSEKKFDVAIKAQNVPDGYRIRMFPDHVQLVCKAGIETLKGLEASDFEVVVDYNAVTDNKYLFVELAAKPDDVFSVRLLQNRIEFVLEKI
jgi:hypothetical protein